MSWDYGNARVATLGGRLLDAPSLRRIADAGSPHAILQLLDRHDDWRPTVREARAAAPRDDGHAAHLAIEWYRAGRLSRLPGFYPTPARELVEALVLPLDRDRVVEILRHRLAGDPPDGFDGRLLPGALLGVGDLAALAHAETVALLARGLVPLGLLLAVDALAIAELDSSSPPDVEKALLAGIETARAARARGHDPESIRVRAILEAERVDRASIEMERQIAGPVAAGIVEHAAALARLDRLAREDRRDPNGVGRVAGYIAGIEGQTMSLASHLAACLERAHSSV